MYKVTIYYDNKPSVTKEMTEEELIKNKVFDDLYTYPHVKTIKTETIK